MPGYLLKLIANFLICCIKKINLKKKTLQTLLQTIAEHLQLIKHLEALQFNLSIGNKTYSKTNALFETDV